MTDERDDLQPWLEHRVSDDEPPVRIILDHLPFRIGRSTECDFVIHSSKVSKEHAEITKRRNVWLVHDLGSRNGTFVNGERIGAEPHRIRHGDLVHVANKTFSFQLSARSESREDSTMIGTGGGGSLAEVRDLVRALSERRLFAVFQPIVDLEDGHVRGYECLGRSDVAEGRRTIAELFRIADEQGRALDLSRALRLLQVRDAKRLPAAGDLRVFLNVHPTELREEGELVKDVESLADQLGPFRIPVIEIHENAITDLGAMGRLRAALRAQKIELAYDDFGAGQSRLMELAEVPPDFIKLDISIVRGIDGSAARRDLVGALARVMKDLGIRVLAEGIETEGEREACRAIGCELGQGFLLGHPVRVTDMR